MQNLNTCRTSPESFFVYVFISKKINDITVLQAEEEH
jgi:hypothetical protein